VGRLLGLFPDWALRPPTPLTPSGGRAVPKVETKGDGSRFLNICTGPGLHFPRLDCGQPYTLTRGEWDGGGVYIQGKK